MAEDLISSIIDIAALEKQFGIVNKELSSLALTVKNFPKITIGGDISSLKEYTDKAKEFVVAQNNIVSSTSTVSAAEKQLNAVRQQGIAASKEQNKSLEENIQARIRYQNTLASVKAEEKDNAELLKKGIINQKEYKDRLLETAVQQEKLKVRISETSKQIKEQTKLSEFSKNAPNSTGEAQAQNVVLKRQVSRVNVDDNEKIAELNALIDRNNELIDSNSDKLSKQKINIGNYPTAFSGAFKTLNKELDSVNAKIANGASGKTLDELTMKQTALKNAISSTGKEFTSTSTQQSAFKEAAKQIGVVYGTNSTLFKSFNKEVGTGSKALNDISKEVSSAAGGTGKLTRGFQSVFSVMRNIANIVPGMGLGGLVLLLLTPLSALASSFIDLFRSISDGKEKVRALNEVNEKAVEIYGKEKANVEALTSVARDNNISLSTRQEALKELIAISPNYLKGLTLENIATAEGTKILDAYIGSLQRKAELEAAGTVNAESNKAVANLQAQRQALVELGKTGKASYGDLSEEQRKFFDNSTSLGRINFTADLFNLDIPKSDIDQALKNIDTELKKAGLKVNASISVFKDKFKANFDGAGAAGQLGIIQKLRNEIEKLTKIQPTLLSKADIKTNVAQIKKLQDEIDLLLGKERGAKSPRAKYAKEDVDAEFEIYKINQQRKIDLLNEDFANDKDSFTNRLILLSDFYNARLSLINRSEEKEKKGKSEKERLVVEAKFNDERIRLAKEVNDRLIKLTEEAGPKAAAQAKILGDLQLEIIKKNVKEQEEISKKKFADELAREAALAAKRKELYKQLYSELQSTIFQFLDDNLKREEQDLGEKQRVLDEEAKRKINNINQLGLSEVERVKAVALVEKQAAFDTEQIEKRKRAIAVERAKFEKAASIASIIASTAQAVVAALGMKPYTPANIGLAALTGAIGALQLAKAISTPLPKYALGTNDAKKGPAIGGEIGRELVIPKQGAPYLTPGVPSLLNLMGGETILPADITANILAATGFQRLSGMNVNQPITVDGVNAHLMGKMLGELKDLNRKSRIVIKNTGAIETTAWYQQHFKN